MIQQNDFGETLTYIMEPTEELLAWRFVESHRPDFNSTSLYWFKIGPKPHMSLEMQAQHMCLKGGHKLHFHDFEERDYV